MTVQLWLWWHGQHSEIRISTWGHRKIYGTTYECVVCGKKKRDRARKRYIRKYPKAVE